MMSVWSVLSVVSFAVFAVLNPEDEKLPPVNVKVLRFAEDHLKRKVGDGECWTLADEALAAARGRRPGVKGYSAYEFGKLLKDKEKILPGDIAQFTDAKFESKKGSMTMPKHTAIVADVKGSAIEILHQNFGKEKVILRTAINLDDLTKGKVAFFRPQPEEK